jgi:hypothetical protein
MGKAAARELEIEFDPAGRWEIRDEQGVVAHGTERAPSLLECGS